MNDNTNDVFVIGAGQMRTGTNSLKLALEKLFNGKCYHMHEVFQSHHEHVQLWISAFNEGKLNKSSAEKIFSGYCATVDFPSSAVYKDLMEIYPNAKVVLTTRNSDDWVKSVKNTTMRHKMNSFGMNLYFWILGIPNFPEFYQKILFQAYKKPYESLLTSDLVLRQCYENFNQEVREYIPKERLLEFNSKEGWEPLCKFLNFPVPDEPYPFVNSTEQFTKKGNNMMIKLLFKYGTITTVCIIGVAFIIKKCL